MALHQVLLQGAEFIRRDILIAQGTKTCRDAIKRLILRLDLPVQIIAATLDAFLHFRSQFQLHISGQYLFDTFKRQRFRPHIMYISHNSRFFNCPLSIINCQLPLRPIQQLLLYPDSFRLEVIGLLRHPPDKDFILYGCKIDTDIQQSP